MFEDESCYQFFGFFRDFRLIKLLPVDILIHNVYPGDLLVNCRHTPVYWLRF